MAYLKPGFLPKLFNRVALRFGTGGAKGLVVRGRVSRQPMRVPVIPVEHEGERYLVSTRGESEWVRNIRDAAGGEIDGKPFRAVEIPTEQREPIIATYREVAGKTVDTYWKRLPEPADHPVFRIEVS
jgi:hypothetical protein